MAHHRTGPTGETRGGEGLAFEEVVDRYGSDLFRLSISMVRNREDAEDLLQETFLAAYEGMGKFGGRSSLKTWLIGILLRKVARYHRYRKIRRSVSLHWLGKPDQKAFDRDTATRPREELQNRLDLATMLETVSRKHREVLVLREVLGLSYQEIGESLGIPIGTVESRLYRARKQLAAEYKDFLAD